MYGTGNETLKCDYFLEFCKIIHKVIAIILYYNNYIKSNAPILYLLIVIIIF